MKSYLYNGRARVSLDLENSRRFLLCHGVAHGGVLSQTLFLLFRNDLVSDIPTGNNATFYADDWFYGAKKNIRSPPQTGCKKQSKCLQHVVLVCNDRQREIVYNAIHLIIKTEGLDHWPKLKYCFFGRFQLTHPPIFRWSEKYFH